MKRVVPLILLTTLLSFSAHADIAASAEDSAAFEKIFTDWTDAFNKKNLTATCALFSSKVAASYQGLPAKNYDVICDGFKKIFADKHKTYHYKYTLHDIYRDNNMAAVRVTWYLDIQEPGKPLTSGKDEGLDIFEKDASGHWKIVNYIGYPVIDQFNPIS